jgi:phosphoglycolate phosphatase-like HAD superfamily hydrolase
VDEITHVLFDLDGTLIESTSAIVESYRYAFQSVLGYPYPDSDLERREMLTIRFLELCTQKGGDCAPDLVTAFRERYLGPDLVAVPSTYPGVPELLERLVASGLKIGVVTNKTRVATEHELGRCGLGEMPFACVITAEDATEGKPHPMPVLLGMEAAGCVGKRAVYVGDGAHDIQAANAAGVQGIGAAYGDWGEALLRAAGAYAVIDAPLELIDVLARDGA